MENLNMSSEISFDFFKRPQKGAKPENELKITLNGLYVTFETKV